MARSIIIDTDMLADDALAILLAVASPELDVKAITCMAGRDPVDVITQNTLRVLRLADAGDIPVATGATKPLLAKAGTGLILGQKSPWNRLTGAVEEYMPAPDHELHQSHAVELILSLVNQHANDIELVTLGPVTNIAMCLMQDDDFANKVSLVIMMGGAIFVPGNSAPAAETNVYADPDAARIVFQSGLAITMVGLDVTTKVLMTMEHVERVQTSRLPTVNKFIAEIISSSPEAQRAIRKWNGFPMHDPLAMAVAFDASLVTTERMFVDVETQGELSRGATVGDSRDVWGKTPNVDVCVGVEADRFMEFYVDRISTGY